MICHCYHFFVFIHQFWLKIVYDINFLLDSVKSPTPFNNDPPGAPSLQAELVKLQDENASLHRRIKGKMQTEYFLAILGICLNFSFEVIFFFFLYFIPVYFRSLF